MVQMKFKALNQYNGRSYEKYKNIFVAFVSLFSMMSVNQLGLVDCGMYFFFVKALIFKAEL